MNVPLRQAGEAQLVEGIEVFGIASITQLVAFLRGDPVPLAEPVEVMGEQAGKHASRRLDMADVVNQVEAKWACEVAAAGLISFTCSFMALPASERQCWPSEFQAYFRSAEGEASIVACPCVELARAALGVPIARPSIEECDESRLRAAQSRSSSC